MGALLLHILFIAIGAVVGAATGWLLRGSGVQKPSESPVSAPAEMVVVKAPEADKSLEQLELVMSRVHQLTASVAADVGEHSNRVQAINDELTSGADVVSAVERLMKMNEQMQSQLQAAEQRMQQQTAEIESHVKEARTDALTKLANRRAFDDEIRRCVDNFKTKEQPSCVMMVDVDHFKKFNDTYGHQAGDEVLRNVGRVLRRESTGKPTVCRYGGEEFAVIYSGMDLNAAIPLAEAARSAIAQEVVEFQGMDLKVTASGGVAQLRTNETGDELVKRADVALYVCKENGRNCGYWHDGSTSAPMKGFNARPAAVPAPAAPKTEPECDAQPKRVPVVPDTPAADSVFKLNEELDSKGFRRDRIAGLSDYGTFCRDLDRRLAAYRREQVPTSVLFIAVDDCQKTAEAYGTKAVELIMRTTAQIVKATMREMDHAARCEDNVFALMLPGSKTGEANGTAERIRAAIAACPLPVNGEELQFTVSMGLTEFQPDDEREQVVHRANRALQSAFLAGGNRTEIADGCEETGETRSVEQARV